MEFTNLNIVLQQAVTTAEEYAVLVLTKNKLFSPYISIGKMAIKKIVADDTDEAIDIAHEEIENLNEETAVFVYNDKIELSDGVFDAIITQLFNEDEENGYSFALAYKYENNKIIFLNKRIFLGNIRNCLIF